MKIEKKNTGKSAIGLLAIGVLVVILIAVIGWAFTQPGFLEKVANVIVVIVVALIIIGVIAVIAYMFIGFAMYAKKGDIVQTGVSHSLNDIRDVEKRTLDDDGNDLEKKEQ